MINVGVLGGSEGFEGEITVAVVDAEIATRVIIIVRIIVSL